MSLKGERNFRKEIDRIREEGMKAGKSAEEIERDITNVVWPQYNEMIKVYNEMRRCEGQTREITVPQKSKEYRKSAGLFTPIRWLFRKLFWE